MRVVVQRVTAARVEVGGRVVGAIERGLLVLVGVGHGDDDAQAEWLADKVAGLRVFEDQAGKMNLALDEVDGAVLAVSQFTLLGDVRKGRRPSFVGAMPPEPANALFECFVARIRQQGLRCETGVFGAEMQVSLVNDGPVTLVIDR